MLDGRKAAVCRTYLWPWMAPQIGLDVKRARELLENEAERKKKYASKGNYGQKTLLHRNTPYYHLIMSRLILAFVLLLFSFNAASASGLLSCCDMSKPVVTKAENTPKPCHEMAKTEDKKETSKAAKHCLCASLCAAKITSLLDFPPFNAVSFEMPASYGANDIAVSVDLQPESPPPKI